MAQPAQIPPLRRSTLGVDVYETLTGLVMEHLLAPGARINIEALARDLQVSPTPVREALARLESDGLVSKRPLIGYTVSPLLTRDEFMAMFDLRVVLEGQAARWAAERADVEARARIAAEAEATAAPNEGRPDGWYAHAPFTKLDAQFHDRIANAAGNSFLRDCIDRLHSHLHIHRLFFPYGQTGSTFKEHKRIATAIRKGNPAAAEEAMVEHLERARQRHLPVFDEATAAANVGSGA